MAAKSNRKGGKFENDVAKILSLWITEGKRNDILMRSIMSGGLATMQDRQEGTVTAKHQSGDLVGCHKLAEPFMSIFSVECKHLASLNYGQFIHHGGGPISKAWEQAREAAAGAEKVPMLVMKENYGIPMAAISSTTYRYMLACIFTGDNVVKTHHWSGIRGVYMTALENLLNIWPVGTVRRMVKDKGALYRYDTQRRKTK